MLVYLFDKWWRTNVGKLSGTKLTEEAYRAGFRVAVKTLMVIGVVGIVVVGLSGCEDRFRYPCQSPANWEKPECQKPLCTATQTCPEQLIKSEEVK